MICIAVFEMVHLMAFTNFQTSRNTPKTASRQGDNNQRICLTNRGKDQIARKYLLWSVEWESFFFLFIFIKPGSHTKVCDSASEVLRISGENKYEPASEPLHISGGVDPLEHGEMRIHTNFPCIKSLVTSPFQAFWSRGPSLLGCRDKPRP